MVIPDVGLSTPKTCHGFGDSTSSSLSSMLLLVVKRKEQEKEINECGWLGQLASSVEVSSHLGACADLEKSAVFPLVLLQQVLVFLHLVAVRLQLDVALLSLGVHLETHRRSVSYFLDFNVPSTE